MSAATAAAPGATQQSFFGSTHALALNLEAVFNLAMNNALGRGREGGRRAGREEVWRKERQGERERNTSRDTGRVCFQRAAETMGRLYRRSVCGGGVEDGEGRRSGRSGVGERMPERSLGKNDEVICIRFSVAAAWMRAGCRPER